MFKFTFTHKRFVVAVIYRADNNEAAASNAVCNYYSNVRIEKIDG